jgi:hypothetical protein
VNAEASSNDPTMGITKPRIVINQRDSTLLKIPEIAVTMNRAAGGGSGVQPEDDEKLVSSSHNPILFLFYIRFLVQKRIYI